MRRIEVRERKVFVQELGTQIQDDLKPKCMLLPSWRAAEKGAGGAMPATGIVKVPEKELPWASAFPRHKVRWGWSGEVPSQEVGWLGQR